LVPPTPDYRLPQNTAIDTSKEFGEVDSDMHEKDLLPCFHIWRRRRRDR
jgi:hypothetical protein